MRPGPGAREIVRKSTRTSVRKLANYQRSIAFKKRMKQYQDMSSEWSYFTSTLRDKTTIYLDSWLMAWILSWWETDSKTTDDDSDNGQQQEPQEPRENDEHLTVKGLEELLKSGDADKYVTHYTMDREVGTCRSAVIAETRAEYKKNPYSRNGIYGWKGISLGAGGYGEYGVLLRWEDGTWSAVDGWEVVWAGDTVKATGVHWFYRRDLEKALKNMGLL